MPSGYLHLAVSSGPGVTSGQFPCDIGIGVSAPLKGKLLQSGLLVTLAKGPLEGKVIRSFKFSEVLRNERRD